MRNGKKKNTILLVVFILISVGVIFLLWNYVICRMLQTMFGPQWQIL